MAGAPNMSETPPELRRDPAPEPCAAASPPARARRTRLRRAVFVAAEIGVALVVLGFLAVGGFMVRLKAGPIDAPWIGARIEAELESALGHGLDLVLGPVRVVDAPGGPKITVDGLKLRDSDGVVVLSAPRAEATIDPLAALRGDKAARRFAVVGLELRLEGRPDGSLSLSLGGEDGARSISFGGGSRTGDGAPRAPIGEALGAAAGALFELVLGAQGPLSALERVAITQGRLKVVDAVGRPVADYQDVFIAFDRDAGSGAAGLDLSAGGRAGPWSAQARVLAGREARKLDVSVTNLSSDEIALAAGFRERPVDFDMPISGRATLTLTPEDRIAAVAGGFDVGAGHIRFAEPGAEPFLIDGVTGGFHWDPQSGALIVEPSRLRAGGTAISVQGAMSPSEPSGREWSFSFASTDNMLAPETRADKAVKLGSIQTEGRYSIETGVLTIDKLELAGADVEMSASGALVGGADGPAAKFALKARRMNARDFLRFWPTIVAPEAREWFVNSFRGGVLQSGDLLVDLDRHTIVSPKGTEIPEKVVSLWFEVTDATLDYLPGAPPLTGVAGRGHVGGRSAVFDATAGQIALGDRKLSIAEAKFEAPDFGPDPVKARLTARIQGPLEAALDYLARPAFKPFVKLPTPAQTARGQIDAHLTLDLELGKGAGPPKVRVEAQSQNVTIEKFIGAEKLENASLTIVSDAAGLRVKGEGRALGAPAGVDLKSSGEKGEAVVTLAFDDAARARRGFATAGLSGVVTARLTAPLSDLGRLAKGQVELDFTAASFSNLLGALNKPSGRPAKASFAYAETGAGATLDSLAFDGAGATARGSVSLDGAGELRALKLSQLRLSPGDEMRVEGQRNAQGLALTVRGAALDARPFLKTIAQPGGGDAGALDLDLETTLLTGHNKQAIGEAKLKLSRAGGKLRRFALTGRFGRDPVRVALDGDGETFEFRTADAGSALGFLNLYQRMEGGRMAGEARMRGARVEADFTIRDFILRDEPAVRGLVAQSAAVRNDPQIVSRIDAALVPFERLQASLAKTPEQLTISDAVLSGPNVGLTLKGVVDSHDRLALNGAFVPAYAINNFFSKLPLLGPILGGADNEGLFAVNFKIGGTVGRPAVTANPLSALTPGIFRHIFSYDGSQKAAPPPDRATR